MQQIVYFYGSTKCGNRDPILQAVAFCLAQQLPIIDPALWPQALRDLLRRLERLP